MSVAAPAVVVVTHRGGALLEGCVTALRAQTLAPARIVVVVSSAGPVCPPRDVEAIFLGDNPGFCVAANAGLERVRGQPVLLLNDDTKPLPDCLAVLAAAARCPGIYQPLLLLEADPGRLDNAGHGLLPDGFNAARGRGRAPPPSQPETVGGFSGAAVLFTPEVLAETGFFDADFEAYGEDVDLSLRAARLGFDVHLVPQARILHALGATYGRVSPRKVFLVERNRVRAAARSLPLSLVAVLPLVSSARLGVQALAAVAGRGHGAGVGVAGAAAALAGGLAGLSLLPDAWRKRSGDHARWRRDEAAMGRYLWQHRVPWRDLVNEGAS